MRGIDNGWEKTPKVRLSLLGYNRPSIINRPEHYYPPSNFQYTTLYLDAATAALASTPPHEESVVAYQADSPTDPGTSFTYNFASYTELCGFSKLTLFASTVEHDDMVGHHVVGFCSSF